MKKSVRGVYIICAGGGPPSPPGGVAWLTRRLADKQRCVEIALKEFANLSDRAIAEMCGVSDPTVAAHRPTNCKSLAVEPRTGLDGKVRRLPAKPEPAEEAESDLFEGEGDWRYSVTKGTMRLKKRV